MHGNKIKDIHPKLKELTTKPNLTRDRECAEGLAEILARCHPELASKSKADQTSEMLKLIHEIESRMFSTRH